jgi:hypothetical protein
MMATISARTAGTQPVCCISNGIDPTTIRRRTPIEVVYDMMLYYGGNQKPYSIDRLWKNDFCFSYSSSYHDQIRLPTAGSTPALTSIEKHDFA